MPTNTPLQSIVLTSSSSSVTFSNIDQSYTDLVLVTNVKGPTSNLESLRLRFNGDSGTNYSVTWMRGDGTSASSGRETSQNVLLVGRAGFQSEMFSPNIIQIINYSNTTTNKTCLVRSSAPQTTSGEAWTNVGLWRSTAAITSIVVSLDTSLFAVGSTFDLYGISSGALGAKATGGIISVDANYYYHTITSPIETMINNAVSWV
jgi:hypothetical protein